MQIADMLSTTPVKQKNMELFTYSFIQQIFVEYFLSVTSLPDAVIQQGANRQNTCSVYF